MGLVLIALINWLLKFKMHANTYLFLEIFVWKYDMNFLHFLDTWSYAWKQDIFFVFYIFFATFQRKSGILILDLYLYSVKMQTNIKQNW